MIIRSQDKRGIVNLENIDTVCMNDEFEIYAFNGNVKSFIGEYSTEEKAIKVLDMITESYVRSQALYIDRENNARVIPQNIAIQMPADEDVEV